MGSDIAVYRISCKPQKLQTMWATVEIGRGSGSAEVCRLRGEDEQDQATRSERADQDRVPGM